MTADAAPDQRRPARPRPGRCLRQSFAWWSFTLGVSVEPAELLTAAAGIGLYGVEMLPEALWPLARQAGLALVTDNGHPDLHAGFNDPARHDELRAQVTRRLQRAQDGGVEHLIVFAGNRQGRPDDEAAEIVAQGLAPLAARAADAGVPLLLELLNSAVDHPGQQGDSIAFCAAVVEQVASPGLRVLYDVYHACTMGADGGVDLLAHLPAVGHVHVAGVPGRRDLDDQQSVDWAGVLRRLAQAGYPGVVGPEFVPRGEPVAALQAAYTLVENATTPHEPDAR